MDQDEELGGSFLLAVDELGLTGLWSSVKEVIESRLPLQNLQLVNKLGNAVTIAQLPMTLVQSTDKRLHRLKPFSQSSVIWFRNPYAHVILVSTADMNEYRANVKNQVKRCIADVEREWGGTAVSAEWLIVYVRPVELDAYDKAAKKVFERLREEFATKKRDRVVRIDLPLRTLDARGRRVDVLGLDEFDMALKDCVKSSFELRQGAYMDEIKKMMNDRLSPSWSFSSLYLIKDSFALMLEAGGLHVDSFKEYVELEAVYLEMLDRGKLAVTDFNGGVQDGDDTASLVTSSWRIMRRTILKTQGALIPEFRFRQYLFAAQSRLLLRLGRPSDVADRGLKFIQTNGTLLGVKLAQRVIRPWFRECWTFSACMALIVTITSSVFSRDFQPDGPTLDSIVGGKDAYRATYAPSSSASNGVSRDWQLGLPVNLDAPTLDVSGLAGQALAPTQLALLQQDGDMRTRESAERLFFIMLGHLYETARQQLLTLAAFVAQRQQQTLPTGVRSQTASARTSFSGVPRPSFSARPSDSDGIGAMSAASSSAASLLPVELQRLHNLSRLMGRYVDTFDDEKFESTPTTQATQQQVLQACLADALLRRPSGRVTEGPPQSTSFGRSRPDVMSDVPATSPTDAATLPPPPNLGASASLPHQSSVAPSGTFQHQSVPNPAGVATTSRMHAHHYQLYSQQDSSGSGRDEAGQQQQQREGRPVGAHHRNDSQIGFSNVAVEEDRAPGFRRVSDSANVSTPMPTPTATTSSADQLHLHHHHITAGAIAPMAASTAGPPLATLPLPPGATATHGGSASALTTPAPSHPQQQSTNMKDHLFHNVLGGSGGGGAGGPTGTTRHHQHSASLDSGFFQKLDNLASKVAGGVVGGVASILDGGTSGVAGIMHRSRMPLFSNDQRTGGVAADEGLRLATMSTSAPSESSTSSGLAGRAFRSDHAALAELGLAWVTEPRLRAALASSELTSQLVMQLSTLAAWCLARAGRVRNSSLLQADVSEVLLLQGSNVEMAERLLDNTRQLLATEHWPSLLGEIMPRILWSQWRQWDNMLPYSAVRYLALPASATRTAQLLQAMDQLLAASCTGRPRLSIGRAAVAVTSAQLQMLQAIQAAPVSTHCSNFYGQEDADGEPRLQPPPALTPSTSRQHYSHDDEDEEASICSTSGRTDPGQQQNGAGSSRLPTTAAAATPAEAAAAAARQPSRPRRRARRRGAQQLAVGDVATLEVIVFSTLPKAIPLGSVSLVLGCLSNTVPASGPITRVPSVAFVAPPSISGVTSLPNESRRGVSDFGGPSLQTDFSRTGARGATDASPSGRGPWCEAEELICTQLVGAQHLRDESSGTTSTTGATAALRPADSLERGAARKAASGGGGLDIAGGVEVALEEAEALAEAGAAAGLTAALSAAAGPGGLLLQPGGTRLTFRVSATRPGLYFLKCMTAVLNSFDLRIQAISSSALRYTQQGLPDPSAVGAAGSAPQSMPTPLGQVKPDGDVAYEEILMRVLPVGQRLTVRAVAVQGSLVAGLQQWLGLVISPLGEGGTPLQYTHVGVQPRSAAVLRITEPTVLPGGEPSLTSVDEVGFASLRRVETLHAQQCRVGVVMLEQYRARLDAAAASAAANPAASPSGQTTTTWAATGDSPPRHPVASTTATASTVVATSSDRSSLPGQQGGGTGQQAGGADLYGRTSSSRRSSQQPHAGSPAYSQGQSAVAGHQATAGDVLWAPLQRGNVLDVAAACGRVGLAGPLLVWLPVVVGQPEVVPEAVRVQRCQPAAPPQRRLSMAVVPAASVTGRRPSIMAPAGQASLNHAVSGSGLSTSASGPSLLPTGSTISSLAKESFISQLGAGHQPPPTPAGNGAAAALSRPLLLPRVDLDVNLEYQQGCWRAHTTALSLPVRPLFVMASQALQLPDNRVLVQVCARSNVVQTALLVDCELTPQVGLVVVQNLAMSARLLPLTVPPGTHFALTFMLQRAAGESRARQFDGAEHCELALSFVLQDSQSLPGGKALAGHVVEMVPPPTSSTIATTPTTAALSLFQQPPAAAPEAAAASAAGGGLPAAFPPPPTAPPPPLPQPLLVPPPGTSRLSSPGVFAGAGGVLAAAAVNPFSRSSVTESDGMQGGGGGGSQMGAPTSVLNSCLHRFLLEFPVGSGLLAAQNVVRVTLLGPFWAHQGEPVALVWQLMRVVSSGEAGQRSDDQVPFSATPSGTDGAAGAGSSAAPSSLQRLESLRDGNNNLLLRDTGSMLLRETSTLNSVASAALTETERDEVLFYEIPHNDRSSSWRSAATCKGTVRLGCARGSLATVEALVTPHSAGPLLPPQLHLRGVTCAGGDDDGAEAAKRIMVSV